MIILDTDIVTLYFAGHPGVARRMATATDVVATSIVTRIEILRGRFDSVLKSADGSLLLTALQRLASSESHFVGMTVIGANQRSADEYTRLRAIRGLRKIGAADLMIASIVLANRATLVTRNRRHFALIPALPLDDWTN